MKIPAFISKPFILLREKVHVWDSNRRYSQAGVPVNDANLKEISMKDLYQIIGNISEETLKALPDNDRSKRPISPGSDRSKHPMSPSQEAYIERVRKESIKNKLEEGKHIIIEKMINWGTSIDDMNRRHSSTYKITIKNLMINLISCLEEDDMSSQYPHKICFDALPLMISSDSSELICNGSITIVFEGNHFILPQHNLIIVEFHLGDGAYLIFNHNKFSFSNMALTMGSTLSMARLNNNVFNGELGVRGLQKGVVLLKNNNIPRLVIADVEYSLKGRNRIDEFGIKGNIPPLHWGPYQNIDPKGENAHNHKTNFITLIEYAIKKNDKMLEATLRRELLKCERALIREEKTWHSLQDGFILWWSSLISDYGTSWGRPILGLFVINAFFATIVFYSFECQSSWGLLFFQFFNPLSNLSDIENIKGSEWIIAAINVVQKAFLALFLYEIIKIFRRFSK